MIASELIARVTVQGAEKAKADLLGVGAASDDLGSKLAKGLAFGALAAGVAIVGVGIAATKMAADFQQQVNRLKTGGGDIQDTFNSLWSGIQKVADSTGVMTKPLSDAMYLVVSSGQRGAQAMNTLQAAAQGAQIEMANVTDVAQILTTIQTNFGLKTYTATQYMDGLVAAVSHGKITLQDLSTAMSPILPMAHELGIHFSDVSAALADMTNQGVPADRAAQALRFTMQSLIEPTKASRTAMAQWGLDSAKAAETMKTSLPDALQMYIDAAKRAGAEGTQPFIDALGSMVGGGARAGQALWALSQSMGTWRQDIKDVNAAMKDTAPNVAGWTTAQSNLNIQLDRGKAALETMMQNLGAKLIPILTPVIGKFADWAARIGDVISHTDFSGLASTIQGIGRQLENAFSYVQKIGGFVVNSQSWKDTAKNIGAASQELGIFLTQLQKIGDAKIAGDSHTVSQNIVEGAGQVGSAVTDILDHVSTFFGNLSKGIDGTYKTMSTVQEAVFQLNGTIDKGALSVQDATGLMNLGYKSVRDNITGANIDLKVFTETGGKLTNTSISLAGALKYTGETGKNAMLTSRDAAKLLAVGVTSVTDATTGATIDLRILAGMNVKPKIDVGSITDAHREVDGLYTAEQRASQRVMLQFINASVTDAHREVDGLYTAEERAAQRQTLKFGYESITVAHRQVDSLNDAENRAAGPRNLNFGYASITSAHQAVDSLNAAENVAAAPRSLNFGYGSITAAHQQVDGLISALNNASGTRYANVITTNYQNTVVNRPVTAMASGGMIAEPISGVGLRSGKSYMFGEDGPEMVTPMTGGGGSAGSIGSGGSKQAVIINVHIAGRNVGQVLLPDIVAAIRGATGSINV